MAKLSTKTGKAVGKKTTTKVIASRQIVEAPTKVIKAKVNLKYEGARAAWYQALCAHDGKAPEAFLETCAKSPPVLTKGGKAEDPRGWLRFFIRTGVASVEG